MSQEQEIVAPKRVTPGGLISPSHASHVVKPSTFSLTLGFWLIRTALSAVHCELILFITFMIKFASTIVDS